MENENITLEEFFEQIERREQSRPFIVKWIDGWFNGGLFGYRNTYILLHPIKFIREICSRIKWTWQRVFRGWDDRVIWSIDYYLAEKIPLWISVLKERKHGTASCFFEDSDLENENISDEAFEKAEIKQNETYDKIIDGFNEYIKLQNLDYEYNSEEYHEASKIRDEGMELFIQYFGTLWD